MPSLVRRLTREDASAFHALRIEGFRLEGRAFRYAPEDEASLTPAAVADRLSHEFVVGAFWDNKLVGIAGVSRMTGTKLQHRGLLWGMYLQDGHRGRGLADDMMQALLTHAATMVDSLVLTVVHGNAPAVRFYERWGFEIYGVDPDSVRLADGEHLSEALMIKHLAEPPRP